MSNICRRRGSATALNASVVVGARAIGQLYNHIGIYQAPEFSLMANVRIGLRSP
jgi:hypothetical protein